MTTWGVTMVKDEDDVIYQTLRHMETQVDGIVLLENGSTDHTQSEISLWAGDRNCELLVIQDSEPGYYQADKMTKAASRAHSLGASWVIPFDADEIWTHNSGTPINELLAQHDAHHDNGLAGAVIMAKLFNYYTTDVDEGSPGGTEVGELPPFERMTWRMGEAQPLDKVIVAWSDHMAITQGNHNATGGFEYHVSGFEVRHYPYRSAEQFIRKAINGAAAYAATDLPWSMGQHWREYGLHYERGGEDALRAIYTEYFHYRSPSSAGLVHDPARLG